MRSQQIQRSGQSNCMRPFCQFQDGGKKLTTPLTKMASAGGGAGDCWSAGCGSVDTIAYPSISTIRVEGVN
jgi:hypothetical protein